MLLFIYFYFYQSGINFYILLFNKLKAWKNYQCIIVLNLTYIYNIFTLRNPQLKHTKHSR
jgi:hypothetical protein